MGQVGFVRPQHQGLLLIDSDLAGLLDKMANFEPAVPIIRMAREEL
jgi:hypothetical protein